MLFSENNLRFSIHDCAEYSYKKCKHSVPRRNFCALSYRISSDAEIKFSNTTLKIGDGSLTFFPAGIDYTRKCSYDHMIVIHLDIDNYKAYDIQSVIPDKSTDTYEYFRRILEIWTQKQPGYVYNSTALLYECFSKIYTSFSKNGYVPDIISKGIEFIHKNYTDASLKIEDAADICGISEVYFRKLFKTHFGVNPKKYITDLKIEYAKSLLNLGCITVTEAAERSGFNDVKHFSTAFRQKTAFSPSKQAYTYKRKRII